MKITTSVHLPALLPVSRLWRNGFFQRSKECTPLYIERYHGPRLAKKSGAHAFWEMTVVLSGSGELLGTSAIPLQPGVLVLTPPGWIHRELSVQGMDTIWIGCQGNRFEGLHPEVMTGRDPRLAGQWERYWLFAQQAGEGMGAELDARLTDLMAVFLRTRRIGPVLQRDVVQDAIRHMHEHLAEPIRLRDLAERAGCSEGYFSRLFKSRTGQSAVEFFNGLRVRQASHLLDQTGLSVSEIAERVGFSSLFYFSRLFRRLVGLSPRVYRQRRFKASLSP